MSNTDKENEHKNAILIRFKDTKSAKNYFIRYNGQIHNTDMISLCNFDDPHSLKAKLEIATNAGLEAQERVKEYDTILNDNYFILNQNKKLKAELEKAREMIREELENRGIKFKIREDLWDKKASEFLKRKEWTNE